MWEYPGSKVRPPSKVSRLDVGSSKLVTGCVYPPLSLYPRRAPPDGSVDDSDLKGNRMALLNEMALPDKQKLLPLSDLLQEPLSLDLPVQKEGTLDSLRAGAEQLPAAPLLAQAVGSTWGEHVSDGARLSALHLPTEPSSSSSPSSHRLLQPFDFTGASLRPSPPHRRLVPDDRSNPLSSPLPPHTPSPAAQFVGPKMDVHGKRPSVLSRSEARDITMMANKASKESLGSVSSAELLASLARRGGGREGPSVPSGPRVLERLERICGPDHQLQARLQASLQELHQDLLKRICPPQGPAASHTVSPPGEGGYSCSEGDLVLVWIFYCVTI